MTHLSANVWCAPRRLTLRNEDQSVLKNSSNPSRSTDEDRRQVLGSRDVDSSANMCAHESTTTNPLQTDKPAQGDLILRHSQEFANLPDDQVIEHSTDAGFMKVSSKGQYFVTIHDIQVAKIGCPELCRENTLPRDDWESRPKEWIRETRKSVRR